MLKAHLTTIRLGPHDCSLSLAPKIVVLVHVACRTGVSLTEHEVRDILRFSLDVSHLALGYINTCYASHCTSKLRIAHVLHVNQDVIKLCILFLDKIGFYIIQEHLLCEPIWKYKLFIMLFVGGLHVSFLQTTAASHRAPSKTGMQGSFQGIHSITLTTAFTSEGYSTIPCISKFC